MSNQKQTPRSHPFTLRVWHEDLGDGRQELIKLAAGKTMADVAAYKVSALPGYRAPSQGQLP